MRCDDCRFAEWKRTKAGRLPPDGSGYCGYLKEHPLKINLPSAFYFIGFRRQFPPPSGGQIQRGHEFDDCPVKEVKS